MLLNLQNGFEAAASDHKSEDEEPMDSGESDEDVPFNINLGARASAFTAAAEMAPVPPGKF